MRTKNPAEEFGVAQYSDGRTGREAERTASRVGGRSFNLRPHRPCRYTDPIHCTVLAQHAGRVNRLLFTLEGSSATWAACRAAALSRLGHVEPKLPPGSNEKLLDQVKSYGLNEKLADQMKSLCIESNEKRR